MKLILFLGAGVSQPSGLPNAAQLTELLFTPRAGEDKDTVRIRKLLEVIREYDTADIATVGMSAQRNYLSSGAIYRGKESTYEDLFFLCQQIALWNIGLSDNSLTTPFMEGIEKRAGGLLARSNCAGRLCDLASLGRHMTAYIESVATETLRKTYVDGFDLISELALSPDIEELNIVTLNHDTLVEQFLAANGIAFSDGFGTRDGDVRWSDDRVYANGAHVRLFKLHGSIDWYTFLYDGRVRTAIFDGADVAHARDAGGKSLVAQTGKPSFLSGISKSDAYQRGVYTDIHFHFYALLRECNCVVMSGYGWGDTAINFRFDSWLDHSRANRIVLLHKNPDNFDNPNDLITSSLVFEVGYPAWTQVGQLRCVERYLCDVQLADIRDSMFKAI